MQVVFTEKIEKEQPTTTLINSDPGMCHVMLRFLCDEAIGRESDFEVKIIIK